LSFFQPFAEMTCVPTGNFRQLMVIKVGINYTCVVFNKLLMYPQCTGGGLILNYSRVVLKLMNNSMSFPGMAWAEFFISHNFKEYERN
jgi:hypothetical protein